MVGYPLLFLVCLICWYIAFHLEGYELLSPSSIIFLGFLVSLGLAMVGIPHWNSYPLGGEVLAIISVGFAGVLAASCVSNTVKLRVKRQDKKPELLTHYRTPTWKYAVLFGIVLAAVALRVYETYKIGSRLGYSTANYTELSKTLRDATSTIFTTEAVGGSGYFSFLERQLEKVVLVTGFVSVFLIARGILSSGKRDIVWSAALFLGCCAFQIAAGGRGMIFYWLIALLVALSFYLYHGKSRLEKQRMSRKIVVYGFLVACACAVFMYFAGSLVGRTPGSSFIDYVSFYFGGSAPSLQILCDQALSGPHDGAVNAFYSAHLLLYKVGVTADLPIYSLAWVNCGKHTSNIFTCFGRYYSDFGLAGVFSLMFIATSFMIIVYRYARERMTSASIVVSCFLCAYAFDCAREEFVFSRLLGSTQLINVLLLIVLALFLTRPLLQRVPIRTGFHVTRSASDKATLPTLLPSSKMQG